MIQPPPQRLATLREEVATLTTRSAVAFRMKGDRPQATPTSPSASRTPERFSRGRPQRACVAHVASGRSARPGFGPLWSPALALRSHRPWQKERLGEGELAFYGPDALTASSVARRRYSQAGAVGR